MVVEGDPQTGSIYGDDICIVERSELPPQVHWATRVFYIHAE
ncbi:hypothetical protein PN419_00615 [Halorubrum ezzemoulense]|nr:hypothetical protein [Halorubrum ezzemoulense]MDB9247510.1 hypothetical protein [Halorubrum ezzemoulense]MDB9258581.1 hypothetical protein [Halorubrum ezzemoulense]MDB9264560.1 hypothetical protein [Halorubrum ezzemoulense]MDB9268942.1 hypothetical protein [Halorubrum ezzemoulense]MDB9271528.1 hypothetical protein [Halorubrum ezzemoulense]